MTSTRFQEPHAAPDAMDHASAQIVVLAAAVRALIKTHPYPDSLRSEFDRLIAQTQTLPQFLHSDMQRKGHLRKLAKDLFDAK